MGFLVPNTTRGVRLTGDFTTPSLTAVTVSVTTPTPSSLSFEAAANTSYIVTINGSESKDTATGAKMQVTAPVGATVRGNFLRGITVQGTSLQNEIIQSINTLSSGVFGNAASTVFIFGGSFIIIMGATGGTVALGVASVTSGTVTIYANSTMLITQI